MACSYHRSVDYEESYWTDGNESDMESQYNWFGSIAFSSQQVCCCQSQVDLLISYKHLEVQRRGKRGMLSNFSRGSCQTEKPVLLASSFDKWPSF